MGNEQTQIKSGEEIRNSFYEGDNCIIEGLDVVGTPIVTQEGVTQITFRCADSSTYTYTYNQNDIEHMNDAYIFIVGDSGEAYATILDEQSLNNPKQYAVISVPSAYIEDSTLESITKVLNKVADDYDFTYDTVLSTGTSAGAKRAAAMAMIAQENIDATNCPVMAFWDAAGQGATFVYNGYSIPGVVEYLREHPEEVNTYVANGGMIYQYCSVEFGGDGSYARANFQEFAQAGVPVVIVTNSDVIEHVDAQNKNYASGEINNLFNGFINPILDGTTSNNVYWIFKDGEWISYTNVEDVNKYIAECQSVAVDKKVKTNYLTLESSMSSLEAVLASSSFSSGKTVNVGFSSDTAVPLDENGIVTKLLSGMTSLISKANSEIAAIRQAGEKIAYMEKTLAEEAMTLNLDIKGSSSPAVAVQEFQDILSVEELRARYDKLHQSAIDDFMSLSGDIPKETMDKIREYLSTEGIEYKNEREQDTVIVEEKEKESRPSNGGTFLGDTVANIQATAGTPSQLNTPQIDEEERQTYINAAATASTVGLAALSGAEVNVGNTEGPSLIERGKEWAQGLFSSNDGHAKIEVEGEGGGSASFAEPNTNSTNETITPFRPGDPAIIESDNSGTQSSEEIDAISGAAPSISKPSGGTYVPNETITQEEIENEETTIEANEEIDEIDAITGAAPSVKPPVSNEASYIGGGSVSPSVPDVPSVNVTPTSIDDVATPIEPVVPSEPEIPVEPTPASPEVVTPSEPEVDTPTEIETLTNDVPTTPATPDTPEVVNPTPVAEPEKPEEVLPVDPLTPVTPSNPIKPVRPVDPVKPVKPVSPLKPSGGDKKPEEIVSPEIPVEVEPEVITPSEPETPTVEYNGILIDETPKSESESGNGNALGTIGTVAGVGLALGAAAYGVNQAVTKDKDDDHYEYEKEKEQESLEDQYKEYTVNEEGLNAFGGDN